MVGTSRADQKGVMMRRPFTDPVMVLLGILSFASLIFYFLALHDIWHDYASPEVWIRAGQTLPGWYSPVNRCPLEWGILQAGFLLMLAFHVLLFLRLVSGQKKNA